MSNENTPGDERPTADSGATSETKTKTPSRRRSTASQAAPPRSNKAGESAAAAEADPAPAPTKAKATRKRATKPASQDEPGAAAAAPATRPRLGTTAVLFQPPEPTRAPARRRAEAPAGPPRHGEEPAARDQGESKPAPDHGETDRDEGAGGARRRRRRGGRGRGGEHGPDEGAGAAEDAPADSAPGDQDGPEDSGGGPGEGTSASSRRRRRRRGPRSESGEGGGTRSGSRSPSDEVTALKGSTRLEAKRQRRKEGRDAGRRRTIVSEAEFLARRESVERSMVVREANGRVQIAVLEDGLLAEHYVSRSEQNSGSPMAGNVYLGRVQNVLPSMEAAFVDIGKGRNAVLYAGEVNWDAAGLEGQPRRIEQALKSGDSVLVQVTKEPIGHKGARLTSQITLAGRYLVYVPGGGMTGISRKLPDTERSRLKKLLREIVTEDAGVIVRTAAEGASDEDLRSDVARLQDQWTVIEKKAKSATPPTLLQGEPDLATRVVRDVFNDDFVSLVVQGEAAWTTISEYLAAMAPDLSAKLSRWTGGDVFAEHRIDEQLAKGMERKVWLPSGGSLIIERTEAMSVIDVNTGRFTGSGGTLEETVTRNNLEAAEEIVRQLRLRDIGGIIVIDFIDMVLESNRDLVLRRLVECLGRDRTKHQVAEVTSLGLIQMTRKRIGQGLLEAFSETCPHCNGRGFLVHTEPVDSVPPELDVSESEPPRSRGKRATSSVPVLPEAREAVKATLATIAAAAAHAHEHPDDAAPAPEAFDVTAPTEEGAGEPVVAEPGSTTDASPEATPDELSDAMPDAPLDGEPEGYFEPVVAVAPDFEDREV